MELAPDERVEIDSQHSQVISVTEGVLYVVLGEHEEVLTPGDSLRVPAGEGGRAWNAGDESAEVEVSVGPTRAARHRASARARRTPGTRILAGGEQAA
jgi:quercetin dioxygenase-like cupin family protein